ncbi:hypothetical protein HPP92_010293 [Vanilla planifolia]|uniref:Uncharacterized protein n=1 Tax=Vanilla planifolia TaxID=51239 RepID=A0A835R0M2_VANPL|nr:hypothetical protein HPP92_010293 [Vanilla planifolia]
MRNFVISYLFKKIISNLLRDASRHVRLAHGGRRDGDWAGEEDKELGTPPLRDPSCRPIEAAGRRQGHASMGCLRGGIRSNSLRARGKGHSTRSTCLAELCSHHFEPCCCHLSHSFKTVCEFSEPIPLLLSSMWRKRAKEMAAVVRG